MMPHKGLRPAVSFARRSVYSRQFSTRIPQYLTSRSTRHPSSGPLLSQKPSWAKPGLAAPPLLAFSRFKSTASAPPVPDATPAAPEAAKDFIPTSLDDVMNITPEVIANFPERIGYLKDLGLDFGWGPTGFMEFLLEHIHIWSGTPWWASIIIAAVAIRIPMFFLYLPASDNSARMAAMNPVLQPLKHRMTEAKKKQDMVEMQKCANELKQLYTHAGIKIYRGFLPMIPQVMLGYGTFRLMRAMSELPVPGFENGGFLWITDLTVADPFFIIPLTMGGLFHYVVKTGGESGATQPLSRGQRAFMYYAMPSIMTSFSIFFPASLQLHFATSVLLGMVQSWLLRMPALREWFGMAPLVKSHEITASATSQPGWEQEEGKEMEKKRPASVSYVEYHPPTKQAKLVKPTGALAEEEKKGFLSDAKKEVSGMLEEGKEYWSSIRGAGKQELEKQKQSKRKPRMNEDFLAYAEDYEEKHREKERSERRKKIWEQRRKIRAKDNKAQ